MHSALHLVLEICLQYTPVQLQSWSITSMPNPVAADIYMCQVNLTSPVTYNNSNYQNYKFFSDSQTSQQRPARSAKSRWSCIGVKPEVRRVLDTRIFRREFIAFIF